MLFKSFSFNPIQVGPSFAAYYMTDLENEVRSMVDEILFKSGGEEVSIDVLNYEMKSRGINYDDLPDFCKEMIDEIEVY